MEKIYLYPEEREEKKDQLFVCILPLPTTICETLLSSYPIATTGNVWGNNSHCIIIGLAVMRKSSIGTILYKFTKNSPCEVMSKIFFLAASFIWLYGTHVRIYII